MILIVRWLLIFLPLSAQALIPSDPRDPMYIMRHYNQFVALGVPVRPLKDSLLYLMENWGQGLRTEAKNRARRTVKITNPLYIGIIDYNQSSLEKRFWILNLKNGQVRNYWVSHGTKTGGVFAYQFSNILNTHQTSLGFYLTGLAYNGKFGRSLKLYGLDETNHQAFDRDIVLHPAPYVSPNYVSRHARLGRSNGCLAVSFDNIKEILTVLPTGSLVYAYHDQLHDKNLEMPIPAHDNLPMTIEERTQSP